MKSMPASSSIRASVRLFSQLLTQRSGALLTVMPDEQFVENVPSLNPAFCIILFVVIGRLPFWLEF